MKILLINDVGTRFGGAEAVTLGLRAGLRRRGHDARLLATSAEGEGAANEADYVCFGTTGPLRTLNRVANPAAARAVSRVLRRFQPDMVHLRMFFSQLSPLILPLLRRTPTVYHAAWHEAVCPLGHKTLPDGSFCHQRAGMACRRNGCLSRRAWGPLVLQRGMFRAWRTAIDLVIANSTGVRDRLVEDGIGPVEVVWNGVPAVEPRPPLSGPPTVTCAGRLSWEKGVDVLIRAFAAVVRQIPDARLRVFGSGPERAALDRLVVDLQLQRSIHIVPFMARQELERELRSGWVHAVPSRCREGFGMTAAEAMMRGTAVVASRAGGLEEIVVDRETGRLVEPSDAAELAATLVELLRDRDEAEQLGRHGRERALAHLDEERWIDRILTLYDVVRRTERR